jgi:hypothetical protein
MWIGGVRRLPVRVRDEQGNHRPEIAVWIEPATRFVYAAQLGREAALAEALRAALAQAPREPASIRVGSEEDARLIATVARAIPITVGPTAEIDELVGDIAEVLAAQDAGGPAREPDYVDESVTRAQLDAFFAAADALHRAAPWNIAGDQQLLRLDVPALEIEGVAISITGALGANFGILVFSSFEAQLAFVEEAERGDLEGATSILSLEFERASDVPASWRKLTSRRRPGGFPVPTLREGDGFAGPVGARELQLLTAAAEAIAAFVRAHPSLFTAPWDGRIRDEVYTGPSGLTTRLLAPHPDAVAMALAEEAPRARPRRRARAPRRPRR